MQHPVADQQTASARDDTEVKPNTLHLSVSVTSATRTLHPPTHLGLQSGLHFNMAAPAIIT